MMKTASERSARHVEPAGRLAQRCFTSFLAGRVLFTACRVCVCRARFPQLRCDRGRRQRPLRLVRPAASQVSPRRAAACACGGAP
eukprot:2291691-Prymnesium_polylepis.2